MSTDMGRNEHNSEKSQNCATQTAEFQDSEVKGWAGLQNNRTKLFPIAVARTKFIPCSLGGSFILARGIALEISFSALASKRLEELRTLGMSDPDAALPSRTRDPLFAELWASLRLSDEGNGGRVDDIKRAKNDLFRTQEALPGERGYHRALFFRPKSQAIPEPFLNNPERQDAENRRSRLRPAERGPDL